MRISSRNSPALLSGAPHQLAYHYVQIVAKTSKIAENPRNPDTIQQRVARPIRVFRRFHEGIPIRHCT